MIQRFEVELLEQAYEFLEKIDRKHRKKILQNMDRAKFHTDPKLFKKLDGDIWEFRTLFSGFQYRLLAFWDKSVQTETLVFVDLLRKQAKWIKKRLIKQNRFVNNILKVSNHEKIYT